MHDVQVHSEPIGTPAHFALDRVLLVRLQFGAQLEEALLAELLLPRVQADPQQEHRLALFVELTADFERPVFVSDGFGHRQQALARLGSLPLLLLHSQRLLRGSFLESDFDHLEGVCLRLGLHFAAFFDRLTDVQP